MTYLRAVTFAVALAAPLVALSALPGRAQVPSATPNASKELPKDSATRDRASATTPAPQRTQQKTAAKPAGKTHKLAIQVGENRPEVMNLALNNARNVVEYYKNKGEQVQIEIVAFGPGLHMLRDDTSPVKQRIAEMSLAEPSISFIACANTQQNQSKQEQKSITLISEAKVMPSGVVRLMELQSQGFSYIRP